MAMGKKTIVALLALAAAGVAGWKFYQQKHSDTGNIASGNGRIEATEIDVAAKRAGRIKSLLVDEGDFIRAGQVVGYMDTDEQEAHLRELEAQLEQARNNVIIARSRLAQRESEKAANVAVVCQRQAELGTYRKRSQRTTVLARKGAAPQQEADDDAARVLSYEAAVRAAEAQVKASEASIATARSEVVGAESNVTAAQAAVERVKADLKDAELTSPRDGRVQYLVAHEGEVVSAGGRVLNMVDLSDVYMTFFLPTLAAGRLAIGGEARIVLDAAKQYVIPASISYVADVAQFTPKTVETAEEREKLMFRIKAKIPADLLKANLVRVKTGLPGVTYTRLDSSLPWPPELEVNVKTPRQ